MSRQPCWPALPSGLHEIQFSCGSSTPSGDAPFPIWKSWKSSFVDVNNVDDVSPQVLADFFDGVEADAADYIFFEPQICPRKTFFQTTENMEPTSGVIRASRIPVDTYSVPSRHESITSQSAMQACAISLLSRNCPWSSLVVPRCTERSVHEHQNSGILQWAMNRSESLDRYSRPQKAFLNPR